MCEHVQRLQAMAMCVLPHNNTKTLEGISTVCLVIAVHHLHLAVCMHHLQIVVLKLERGGFKRSVYESNSLCPHLCGGGLYSVL